MKESYTVVIYGGGEFQVPVSTDNAKFALEQFYKYQEEIQEYEALTYVELRVYFDGEYGRVVYQDSNS